MALIGLFQSIIAFSLTTKKRDADEVLTIVGFVTTALTCIFIATITLKALWLFYKTAK